MLNLLFNSFHTLNLNVFRGRHGSDFFSIFPWNVPHFSMRQSQSSFNIKQLLDSSFFFEDFEHFWRSITTSIDWQDRQVSVPSKGRICRLKINVLPMH